MCNFYGQRTKKIRNLAFPSVTLDITSSPAFHDLELVKDGFRYSNSLILEKGDSNNIQAVSAHWEFIPPWIKNMDELKNARKKGIPWLNATSEKLVDSKMFRGAALKRRCLVPATHFFEWRHYRPEWSKKDIAYPYQIEVGEYFYMAGIWQPWTDRETGEIIDTYAIVTTKANTLMEQIHNKKKRMPTILPQDVAWRWMMEDLPEDEIRSIAGYQIPSEAMNAFTIPKDFKLLEEPSVHFDYPELPPIETTP